MNHITELYNFGQGQDCLIIGGGCSLNDIDWQYIPDDLYVIATNNHCTHRADMIIYYDKDIRDHFNSVGIDGTQTLIGFKHKESLDHTCGRCDYYYTYNDMVFGDTGFHALQFADKIFNFNNIYLAGYDYYTEGVTYHANEVVSDEDKIDRFKKWSIGKVLDKYSTIAWKNNIFNLNPDSMLDVFNFSVIVDN